MGKGKRRHTAKTGDTKLYESRSKYNNNVSSSKNSDDEDGMYNEVDRYHNKREEEEEEYINLNEKEDSDEEEEDDGVTTGREGVFDLGIGGSSDEEEEDSDEDSEDDDDDDDDKSDASSSDNDDDDDDELEKYRDNKDVRDWGSRKRDYYHGDTADIEVEQEEEDAEMEEEAGKEVIKARYDVMDEGDFMLDDDDEDDDEKEEEEEEEEATKKSKKKTKSSSTSSSSSEEDKMAVLASSSDIRKKALAKLSKQDKLKLLDMDHPELVPLVTHFKNGAIQDLNDVTDVVCNALLSSADGKNGGMSEDAKAVGTTKSGLQYLLTKSMIQTSTALNVVLYLLLKTEQAVSTSSSPGEDSAISNNIKDHPVIARLNQLNDLSNQLKENVEDNVGTLKEQMENLVKAAALMGDDDDDEGELQDDDDVTESSGIQDEDDIDDDDDEDVMMGALMQMNSKKKKQTKEVDSSSSDEEEEEDEEAIQRRVQTEARFAMRSNDISNSNTERKRRRVDFDGDFGDEDDDTKNNNGKKKSASSLASTMNSISQRSATKDARLKKRLGSNPEYEENNDDEDYQRVRKGLELMEADIGLGGDGEEEDDVSDNELMDDGEDEDGFYKQIQKKSKAKKEYKKSLYEVAPKYPRMSNVVDGERAIGRMIMKNRGLVAHKNKLNRNPRVKKREQYRKALIRRRGAVRDVRTDEGHKYGGEETGIKSGLSRSRKLR